MSTKPFTHEFRTGDRVRMKAGKYCGRVGVITKPTRQMAWVLFDDELGGHLVCLKHQHMEQYRQPTVTLQNATLIEDDADEAPRGGENVSMFQFEQLKQRVETLATRAELSELEAGVDARVDEVKRVLVAHITGAIESLKLQPRVAKKEG